MTGTPTLTLWATVERALRAHSGRIALVDGARSLSFADIDVASARRAQELQRAIPSRAPLVLDLPRGAHAIIEIVAALRSGRGVVPLDKSLPRLRVEHVLATSGASHASSLGPDGAPKLTPLPSSGGPSTLEGAALQDEDLLYVLYTSGSTGVPKGVSMGAGPIARLVEWHLSWESGGPPPRTLQLAPLTFDVSWQEFLTSLALGGTLVIAPDEARRDTSVLFRALSDERITRLFLPTALLAPLADRARRAPLLRELSHVFVAGSQLRVTPEIRAWLSGMKGCSLHNHYGPTEAHVVTSHSLRAGDDLEDVPPIGRPLPHVEARIRSEQTGDVAEGELGELWLGGPCLAHGYRGRPDLTAERFTVLDGERWYRTGDLVSRRDGVLRFHGRADRQVKIDGHRVELAELEALISRHPEVRDVHVAASTGAHGTRLVGYVVAGAEPDAPRRELDPPWRAALAEHVPAAVIPSTWMRLARLPLNANGKVDIEQLPIPSRERPPLSTTYSPPSSAAERALTALWEEVLEVQGIGRDDNLVDLGATSLTMARLAARIASERGVELPLVTLYASPTVASLAAALEREPGDAEVGAPASPRGARLPASEPIAIVGLACRFPGAKTPSELWQSLVAERDCITRVPRRAADEPDRVRAGGVLDDIDAIDAAFFGLSPAQARELDPQQRLLLECAVEALEDAALGGASPRLSIGVYAGTGPSTYLINNLLRARGIHTLTSSMSELSLLMGNDKEFVAARASYTLDLRGPSVNVNAACATSLFAVHHAVRALRAGECDVALAGAASVQTPQLHGHRYEESMPFSPDGHCRVFEQGSMGTVFGNGVGVLALKPLSRAVADGDDIYATILGSGIANDGADKLGMTAPSVSGQERAIRAALADAGVPAASIRYVEAHGTGTQVGDAIEITALERAYGALPAGSCGIGSIKTNLGHLGWAAGMAGLFKAVLSLRHRVVPPQIHFEHANPALALGESPFTVVDRPYPLDDSRGPARVAVSAFGIGGFDSHVVLERAPERRAAGVTRRWHVLPISARTERAVTRMAERLGSASSQVPTADLARTLSLGRRHHDVRRAAIVAPGEDPSLALRALGTFPRAPMAAGRPVVGLFAGHSHERSGLARALYDTEPVYRAVIDGFDDQLRGAIGTTVGEILYTPADGEARITDLVHMHVAVFAMQLGLLRLWESRGPRIDILIGHSLGQYAAACAAGVLRAEDAMRVLIARGRAIGRAASDGTMAIARTDASTVSAMVAELGASIDIAAINGPRNTVIAGRRADLERLTAALHGRVEITMMGALRAGHSRWMEPVTGELVDAFSGIELSLPTRTLLCSVRGGAAGPEMATAAYWGEHLRRTVRFADCVRHARALGGGAFVELGCAPGLLGVASSVIEDHEGPFIPVARPGDDCERTFAQAIATAYEAGLPVDWSRVLGDSGLPAHLPTYPFERERHWIGPGPIDSVDDEAPFDRLFHELRWRPLPMADASLLRPRWGVIGDDAALIERLALERPAFAGRRAVSAVVSEIDHLIVALGESAGDDPLEAIRAPFELILETLSRLAARGRRQPPRLWLVTRNAQRVRGDERVDPVARASWGLARSLRLEQPELRVTLVDIDTPEASAGPLAACVRIAPQEAELAIRRSEVWTARLERSEAPSPAPLPVRPDHAYLVIGGLGGLGLFAAERLAARGARSLVLAGRGEPSAAARERVSTLIEGGCDVRIARLDVADAAAVDALIGSLAAPGAPRLDGIIHAACTIDDAVLADCDWQRAAPVMRAKVLGAWNLHRSLARHSVQPSSFVLCSSASAVHGNYGQGAYAAANAYLQGLALERSRAGSAALAIDWGVLDGVGRVAGDPELRDTLIARGLGTVSMRDLERVLFEHGASSAGELSVLPNRWDRFIEAHDAAHCSVWQALSADGPETARPEQPPTPTLGERVMALPEEARERAVSAHLVELVRRVAPRSGPLGPDTRIADLGLDSLSTIQLRNALQAALQVSLPPRLLAQSPTLGAAVAVALESLAARPPTSRPTPIAAAPTTSHSGPVPLSIEQRRWLRLATEVGYGRRLVPAFVHAPLDRASFAAALRTVISRHDVLRQRYPTHDTAEVMDVAAVLPTESELFVDASGLDPDACAARVASELERLEGEALDARTRPLWSIRCLALPGDRSFLVLLSLQHLEFDGSGLSVFFDELRIAYAAAQRGEAPELPAVVQYRAHAESQARALESGLREERAYFSGLFAAVRGPTQLRGAPSLARTEAHPSRRFTPARPLGRWDHCLSAAERLGVTPFSVVLASYAALLSRVVGEPTVTISIIRSVRTDARLAGTIGPFTMPFPVPVHVRGWSARDLVAQVDETLAEITSRPAYPSVDLRHCARAFAGLPEDTYFGDVGLNFLSYRRPESTGQPRIEPIEILDEVRHPLLARHDFGALERVPGLHLVASPEADLLRGSYWYHLHRFREAQVAGWAATHREILAEIIESCARTERRSGALLSPLDLVGAGR